MSSCLPSCQKGKYNNYSTREEKEEVSSTDLDEEDLHGFRNRDKEAAQIRSWKFGQAVIQESEGVDGIFTGFTGEEEIFQ